MSFFSRKPNPPVPNPVSRIFKPAPPAKPSQQGGVGSMPGLAAAHPVIADEAQQQAPSNTRFRSFCERYIVERCRDWKEDEIDARAWEAILQAKSLYNKVREVGRTLGPDA